MIRPRPLLLPHQRRVTRLIATGAANRVIADALGITPGTVKVYLSKIYNKTGMSNRTELALWALAHPAEVQRVNGPPVTSLG